jgi:type I restriction enzyme R subunit
MVEFKQIIGRGTRLYDGKDYFTIHDFTKQPRALQGPGLGRRRDGPNGTAA